VAVSVLRAKLRGKAFKLGIGVDASGDTLGTSVFAVLSVLCVLCVVIRGFRGCRRDTGDTRDTVIACPVWCPQCGRVFSW
jgi:hypothetical protein